MSKFVSSCLIALYRLLDPDGPVRIDPDGAVNLIVFALRVCAQ